MRSILRRFGLTPHRQMAMIQRYAELLQRQGVRGTFFVPAVIWERYAAGFAHLEAGNIEWGIHGYAHRDYSCLDEQIQHEEYMHALTIFDRTGSRCRGFRAPYLKCNASTLRALATTQRFSYDSSCAVYWDDVAPCSAQEARRLQAFYEARLHSDTPSRPEILGELVELPVSLPDDDILLDREGASPEEVHRAWSRILKAAYARGELFTLQLHPERILELENVLESLLQQARGCSPPIWIATLGEVAAWRRQIPRPWPQEQHQAWPRAWSQVRPQAWPQPYRAALCVTGDIDAVTLYDFIERVRHW